MNFTFRLSSCILSDTVVYTFLFLNQSWFTSDKIYKLYVGVAKWIMQHKCKRCNSIHCLIMGSIYFNFTDSEFLIVLLTVNDTRFIGKEMIEERQSSIQKSYDLLNLLSKERFEILQVLLLKV